METLIHGVGVKHVQRHEGERARRVRESVVLGNGPVVLWPCEALE